MAKRKSTKLSAAKKSPTRYVIVHDPVHFHYKKNGCGAEHIRIAQIALGKRLPKGAQVHHVNRNRSDNRHSNLVICQDAKYHHLLHVRARCLEAGGDPNTDKVCWACRQPKPINTFQKNKSSWDGLQASCPDCKRVSLRVSRTRDILSSGATPHKVMGHHLVEAAGMKFAVCACGESSPIPIRETQRRAWQRGHIADVVARFLATEGARFPQDPARAEKGQ